MTVGLVHPGEMGSALGTALRARGVRVLWASVGRGGATRERARAAGLEDASTVEGLAAASDTILSVCPPHAAREVAGTVAAAGFRGTYVDANAVAPATARAIAETVTAAGARFVDGGIIGPPPRRPGTTRLYLSGPDAPAVAGLFADTVVQPLPLDGPPGAASALKMAYAAFTKGESALLLAIRALAIREGVDDALLAEWARSQPALPARSRDAAAANARKAWRFVGEMEEIATTFAGAGLPGGFHLAAAEVYRRLAGWKDHAEPPSMGEVARTLAP